MIVTNKFYILASLPLFIASLHADEMLLQGETKEFCLYEERFATLFKKSVNEHGSITGTCLLVKDSSILKPMSICETKSHGKCQNLLHLVQCASLHAG